MAPVRILSSSRLPLPRHSRPSPAGDVVRLSFFDTFWIALPPNQRLFLFPEPTLPFPSLLESLKSSLSTALLHFYPLAGKLTYLPNTADVVIDCSAAVSDAGFIFAEAETSCLAGDDVHDMDLFLQLVPELHAEVLPAPMFAVQVTRFVDGCVAVGFAAHHAVADGRGLWKFVEAWASACREGGSAADEVVVPCHDRGVIRHPRGDEIARQFLKQMAPALPVTEAPVDPYKGGHELMRKTFTIGATSIKSLKERALNQSNNDLIIQPSTFVALSAQAWISFVQAKGVKGDEPTVLNFQVDCRTHLDPPVEEGFTGNCVKPCFVEANGHQLLGENRLAPACRMIRSAIDDCLHEPLKNCEHWVNAYAKHVRSRMIVLLASPRFKVYETDFGWGTPSRVELVSMNRDGAVAFVAGKEEGSVQASVVLSSPLQMDTFVSLFMCLSGT